MHINGSQAPLGPRTKRGLWRYMADVRGSVLKIFVNIACI